MNAAETTQASEANHAALGSTAGRKTTEIQKQVTLSNLW
jgi:hypothetical protein